jgi:hypothetical protein
MKNNDDSHYDSLRGPNGPNVQLLTEELTSACTYAAGALHNMLQAENVRYCLWADQQEDGRKPALVNRSPAKPWAGSSDTRIRLADEVIVADVRLMKKVTSSGRVILGGTEGGDFAAAGKAQLYMTHIRKRMRANVKNEGELAAQWRQTYGYAVMSVTWRQQWTRDFDPVTVQQLQQLAQERPAAAQLLALAAEPGSESRGLAANLLRQMYPDLDKAEAYRQLQALRTTGAMRLPIRTLLVNRPEWEAGKLWIDWFMPYNVADEQKSPWVTRRVTLTLSQLEEKRFSEGWKEEFIEEARKTKGMSVLDGVAEQLGTQWKDMFRDQDEDMEGLVEVFYFYYEACDETGLPGKYRTVISPHIKQEDIEGEPLFGFDGPLGYDHGLYPLVVHRRERAERMIAQTRGTPEIVKTNQLEVKWQRDGMVNQTDLALQPPTVRPEREVGLPLTIKPMGEIGERKAQALRFLTVPTVPAQSPHLEAEARRDVMRYFARNRAEDPVGAGLADQDLADDWAAELDQCWNMTLQLAQQFEQPQNYLRIVGGKPQPFNMTRDEIRGQHDLEVTFNTSNLDPQQLEAKAKIAQTILMPMDRSGKIDWAPVVAGTFAYFFPEFADQAIRSDDQADAAEIKDEANNWGFILSGTEPEMVDNGQNFQLRLQWLETKMKEPGAMARLSQLPDSAELANRRLEHLRFVVSQHTDQAQAGRTGVQPQKNVATA